MTPTAETDRPFSLDGRAERPERGAHQGKGSRAVDGEEVAVRQSAVEDLVGVDQQDPLVLARRWDVEEAQRGQHGGQNDQAEGEESEKTSPAGV